MATEKIARLECMDGWLETNWVEGAANKKNLAKWARAVQRATPDLGDISCAQILSSRRRELVYWEPRKRR